MDGARILSIPFILSKTQTRSNGQHQHSDHPVHPVNGHKLKRAVLTGGPSDGSE